MKTIKYFCISYFLFFVAFLLNIIFISCNCLAVFVGKDPALSFAGQIVFFRYSLPLLIAGAGCLVWLYRSGKLVTCLNNTNLWS